MKGPKALHPAFYGSFDWHSSVHGHWMLVRLLKMFPDLPQAKEIRSALNDHLTAANLKAEADYFARPESRSFERPYGWAWLLKLAEELHGWDDPDAKKWLENLKPLTDVIVAALSELLPEADLPDPHRRARQHRVRAGLRPRLRPVHREHEAPRTGGGTGQGLLRQGRGRARRVGAGRGRLLLAELDGSRPDAPRAAAGRVSRLVPKVPARRGSRGAQGTL